MAQRTLGRSQSERRQARRQAGRSRRRSSSPGYSNSPSWVVSMAMAVTPSSRDTGGMVARSHPAHVTATSLGCWPRTSPPSSTGRRCRGSTPRRRRWRRGCRSTRTAAATSCSGAGVTSVSLAHDSNCCGVTTSPRVVHGAVPDAAQLGAADDEGAELLGGGVGHVVVVGVGVGLHAQLVGPEAVDHVERGDVELDRRVVGDDELVGLEPAEGRVAVGELPLLADDLNGQDRLRGGGPDRARPLPAACPAGLDELVGAEAEEDRAR